MDDIFINSEKNKSYYPFRLVSNLADEIDLKSSDKYVASSNLSNYYSWENIKKNIHDVLIILSKCMGNLVIILQYKSILSKLKEELHLKSRTNSIFKF